MLRVALLSALLEGAMSPRSCLPQKDMKFGRWAAISNGGAVCGVILTVILSFIIPDVWALAIGYCSENVFRCLLSYILCPGLPSLGWDRAAARDLLSYSRGAYGLSFLNLIFTRTDIFVLAKLYSPTVLGLYTMAVYLVQTPTGFIQNMVGSTLLPAFAHVQEDHRAHQPHPVRSYFLAHRIRASGSRGHLVIRPFPSQGHLWGSVFEIRWPIGRRHRQ